MLINDLEIYLVPEQELFLAGHWSSNSSKLFIGRVWDKNNKYAKLFYKEHYDYQGRPISVTYEVEYETPVGEGQHKFSGGIYHHLHEAIGAACGMFAVYR